DRASPTPRLMLDLNRCDVVAICAPESPQFRQRSQPRRYADKAHRSAALGAETPGIADRGFGFCSDHAPMKQHAAEGAMRNVNLVRHQLKSCIHRLGGIGFVKVMEISRRRCKICESRYRFDVDSHETKWRGV